MILGKIPVLLLLAAGSAFPQTHPAVEGPTTLRAASSTVWSSVPLLQANGNTQCDSDANLYFQTGPADSVSILKLAHDGSKYELYGVPADVARNAAFRAFSVSPSGELRALADTHDHHTYAFEWRSDPGNPRQTKLEVPEHLTTKSFAVFPSGTMLVTGYFNQSADEQERGKIFMAVFGSSGKLVTHISGKFGNFDLGALKTKLYESASAVGDDGLIYLLRADEVVAISASGQAVRRMPFKKPDPSLLATGIYESGGTVLVQLFKNNGMGKPVTEQYLTMDASTGRRIGFYEPGPDMLGSLVCFTRNEGLTFITVKEEKQVLVTVPLP